MTQNKISHPRPDVASANYEYKLASVFFHLCLQKYRADTYTPLSFLLRSGFPTDIANRLI